MKVRALMAIASDPMRSYGDEFEVGDESAAAAMIASGAVEAVKEEAETPESDSTDRGGRKRGRG